MPQKDADKIEGELRAAQIIHAIIGKTQASKTLSVTGEGDIALSELRKAHEGWFPAYMSKEEVPPTN